MFLSEDENFSAFIASRRTSANQIVAGQKVLAIEIVCGGGSTAACIRL